MSSCRGIGNGVGLYMRAPNGWGFKVPQNQGDDGDEDEDDNTNDDGDNNEQRR